MADEDDKRSNKLPAVSGAPPKFGRRDLLMGLSTVPALGLFGYSWNRQRQYQEARVEAAFAPPTAPADLQQINVAILGGGSLCGLRGRLRCLYLRLGRLTGRASAGTGGC